jgi:hypothetical protein
MGTEYLCRHCRSWVYNSTLASPPPHGLCFRCAFLEENIPDAIERQEVRDYLDRDMSED